MEITSALGILMITSVMIAHMVENFPVEGMVGIGSLIGEEIHSVEQTISNLDPVVLKVDLPHFHQRHHHSPWEGKAQVMITG